LSLLHSSELTIRDIELRLVADSIAKAASSVREAAPRLMFWFVAGFKPVS
jgi:hypothetical protein